ncbi:hypothetical protein DL93DRAFT_1703818 [Clavulina sp. PMI_390]|nr:hypothetical protein DL93DRAFT_1703818 [Clavulina sp. PMI_390]
MHHAPSWLILSKDVVLQRLIADVPFFATGILAFAVALLLLMKKRVNIMTSMIMLSAVFSFIAALLDLVILVEQSNLNNVTDSDSTSNSTSSSSPNSLNEGHVGVRVIIQMLLASALTLRFLFIWHYVGLPAREETPTPVTVFPSSSFLPTDADMHSGSWLQWGIFGIILKYFLLAAVVAVGVLESIWRLEQVFTPGIGASAVEAASGTLEVALSILFLLKLLGNLLFTKTIRKKLFIGSIPLLMSMAISAGAGVGAVFVENFLDYPLGRFLQALEIYIMCRTFSLS